MSAVSRNPGDREYKCCDCGRMFVFTIGEQKSFRGKGLKNDPKRCKSCREKNKKYGDVRGVNKRDDVTTRSSATKNQINISSTEFGLISGDYAESRGSDYFMSQDEADKMNR